MEHMHLSAEEDKEWINRQAVKTMAAWAAPAAALFWLHPDPASRMAAFWERLQSNFHTLFSLLYELYGSQYDFFFHLEAC